MPSQIFAYYLDCDIASVPFDIYPNAQSNVIEGTTTFAQNFMIIFTCNDNCAVDDSTSEIVCTCGPEENVWVCVPDGTTCRPWKYYKMI